MKIITILILLFTHSYTWSSNTDLDELGHSISNYQACSKISYVFKDEQMFNYYQKMFNDTRLELLKVNRKQASQIYDIWDKSEIILKNIEQQSLHKICLSRFGELSRQLLNQIENK